MHVGEGDEAVEAGAHGSYHLAFVLGCVLCARGVATSDCGNIEGVGVGVGFGFEDVADAQVNEGRREGLLDWCSK